MHETTPDRASAALPRLCALGTRAALKPDRTDLKFASVEDKTMLYWAAVFFVIALAAAFFGFGGIAASAAGIAKILFFVFLVLAVVSLLFGRRAPL
jgi:uncharacterized membrane protein YtjA (UPF0391 family)